MKELKKQSLKVNYIFNNIRLLLNLLLPLITLPYISRVLGPEKIGQVDFANTFISYFILFSELGIQVYGVREIARQRDNEYIRSKVVLELSLFLMIMTVFSYFLYFIIIYKSNYFKTELLLYLVIAPALLLTNFNFEWFYIGIEDQSYITIRYIFIKILQLLFIFAFIKQKDDYLKYAGILIGMNGFATLFNILRLKKYINFISFRELSLKRHIKPMLVIFSSIVAANVYTHLDVTMVGTFVDQRAVGIYTTSNRIVRFIITFTTSLSTVMIPRIENCLKKGDIDNYNKYVNDSLHYILCLSIPCVFGVIVVAPEIIELLAGKEFFDSIICMRMLAVIIFLVSMANFVGLQLLYVNRREKDYSKSVIIAALINFVCNMILIPRFKQTGAVCGTVVAELTGLLVQMVFAKKYLKSTDLFSLNTLKFFLSGIIMFIFLYFIRKLFAESFNVLTLLIIEILIGAGIYYLSLILMQEKTIKAINRKVLKK